MNLHGDNRNLIRKKKRWQIPEALNNSESVRRYNKGYNKGREKLTNNGVYNKKKENRSGKRVEEKWRYRVHIDKPEPLRTFQFV